MLDRLQLVEMRMRKNPVNSSCRDEETVRQLVIARTNGTQINHMERKWADFDYLNTYGVLWTVVAGAG